jgi:O-antigen/teichoic acid export membrane protein
LSTIKKQSIISTIYIYLGVAIAFVSTGILMPRFLSEEQNGIIKLLVSYSLLFAQIASLGFQTATVRFFPYFKDKEKGHNGFFPLLSLVGVLGFILFLIIYYSIKGPILEYESGKNSSFANYFFLILPLTFFFLYFNLFDIYARVLLKSTIGSFLKELLQRLLILLAIVLYILNILSFWQFTISYVAILSLPTVVLFFYLLYKGEIFIQPDFRLLREGYAKPIASLSLYGVFIGFSTIAISQIDSILINFFKDTAHTGIYAITFYYGTLVILPSRAIFRIAPSFIAEAFKQNDMDRVNIIQFKSCLNQLLVGTGIFLLLWLNIDNVFKILPPEYLAGKYVILFIGLANLISMAGGLSSQIITNSNYYRYNGLFVVIYLVLTVLLNILLIPVLGIKGAAISAMISMLVFNILKFVFIYRKFEIQPYKQNHIRILLIGVITYIITALFTYPENLILNIFLKSSLFSVLFILMNYFTHTSEDFIEMIEKYIPILRKK